MCKRITNRAIYRTGAKSNANVTGKSSKGAKDVSGVLDPKRINIIKNRVLNKNSSDTI